jgi:hypothetical protein
MIIIEDFDTTDLYLETIPRADGYLYGIDEYGIDQRLSVDKVYELHCHTMLVASEKVKQLMKGIIE